MDNLKICRCCGKIVDNIPLLKLKNVPSIVQNFPYENELSYDFGIDLDLLQCNNCGLVQICHEPVYYYKDVIRAVAVSDDMREFRKAYFHRFVQNYNLSGKKIIEIGAGSGEYMSMMAENNVDIYGIEHLKESCEKAKNSGMRVFNGYLEDENYLIPNAPYDGFYIMNFLEHIPNLSSFLQAIWNNLDDESVGLVEVPNGDMIIANGLFSEIMLDHLSYFTEDTLRTVLDINGFEVLSLEVIWHDYILSAVVRKRKKISTDIFKEKISEFNNRLSEFVQKYSSDDYKLAIWGAGHQALLLMSMYDDIDKFEYVIDSANFKQHRYTPVSHRYIISPEEIVDKGIGAILVIGGSYSDEICNAVRKNYPSIHVEKI